jgi:hypothetical protein
MPAGEDPQENRSFRDRGLPLNRERQEVGGRNRKLLIFKHDASSDSTTSAPNAWDSPRLPFNERICVHLIPHDFQWLTPDLLTLSF